MKIGVPKEIKTNENRIALVPAGAETLVAAGHSVLIETGAGLGSGFTDEDFVAVDARSGKPLWHYPTGASIWGAAATTYMLDGRQYVLIPSGTTLVAFALP